MEGRKNMELRKVMLVTIKIHASKQKQKIMVTKCKEIQQASSFSSFIGNRHDLNP